MNIREMTEADIASVIPMYVEYYNRHEDGNWIADTAHRRIRQVITMQDAYSLILEENGEAIGFVMGYFKQYDDIVGYTLEEILITSSRQNQGIGTWFLSALEARVRERGAALIELLSVNDDLHDRYYGRANYYKASSLIPRGKWLREGE